MAEMPEMNARREARRRRILENSENRLSRITGRINPGDIKDSDPQVKSNSCKAELSFKEDNVGNGTCNIRSNAKLDDYAGFKDRHHGFLNETNDEDIHTPEQAPKSKFILYTLLFNRINFVLLAGIVNILLVLKLENLFGQAVIIPFLLLLVGRLCSTTLYEAQNSSLLVAALILCNVKPRVIYIFKVSFMLFTTVLNDFGLYMFSFVLMRYLVIRYYYHDTAVPIKA